MDFFPPREPMSAWTHALWFLAAIPGIGLLLWRTRGDRPKQVSMLAYGLSLLACAGSSALYHAAHAPADRLASLASCDFASIYCLIAGSYTPIAWTLLRGRWRQNTLVLVWFWAFAGVFLTFSGVSIPPWVPTILYLVMGWGASLCYVEILRRVPSRTFAPILGGGLVYTAGAIINLLRWPVLLPGVCNAHDLFHVIVTVGSFVHYRFYLTCLVPFEGDTEDVRHAAPGVPSAA